MVSVTCLDVSVCTILVGWMLFAQHPSFQTRYSKLVMIHPKLCSIVRHFKLSGNVYRLTLYTPPALPMTAKYSMYVRMFLYVLCNNVFLSNTSSFNLNWEFPAGKLTLKDATCGIQKFVDVYPVIHIEECSLCIHLNC